MEAHEIPPTRDFDQATDEEVVRLLGNARHAAAAASAAATP
jgi:hypothetical protein